MSEFAALVARITREINSTRRAMPPTLAVQPALPDRPIRATELITHNGWKYRALIPGVIHAWPDDRDFYEGVLALWHAVLAAPARRLVDAFRTGLGPILTGAIVVTGRSVSLDKPLTVMADAITNYFDFDEPEILGQFCPVLSLSATTPVESFLKEVMRCYRYNGQLSEEEYQLAETEMYSDAEPRSAEFPPGRLDNIGEVITRPGGADKKAFRIWIAAGEILAEDHPRFKVEPRMIEPATRWPESLKAT
ncbi:hypothetical protein KFF05_09375 [bacterium SCSIO 12827]|nr:hypothetical protein KFF05_09375 [bacterium SCSIO 12827]